MESPERIRTVALYYASRGWRVFPVIPDGSKRPAITDWPNVASADPSRVESWWSHTYHGYDIGIVCGPESDLLVVDIDLYKEEAEGEFEAWCAEHGACPDTPEVVTPRGGRHIYLHWPTGVEPSQSSIGKGIDVQGIGRYVVAPPSRGANGQDYAWEESCRPSQIEVAHVPAAWIEGFGTTSSGTVTSSIEGADDADAGDECGAVLLAAGFTPSRIDRKGQMHWTRPGKSAKDGISATVYPAPDHHAVIWSSSVPGVETSRPYGPKGLAAALGVAVPEDTTAVESDVELLDATDGLHLSDVGNSARLIRESLGLLKYARAWDTWLVYRGGRYFKDSRNAIVTEYAKGVPATMLANLPPAGTRVSVSATGKETDQRSREIAWAKHTESATALRAMVEISRAAPGVMIEHEDLDADPELLNVGNCTVDLRTGLGRPHDPADLLTMQTPVLYDQEATAPLWERCLETWQPDPEVRRYLQIRAGACATGRATESLDIDWGNGGNGKSRFHSTIHHCLGDYAMIPDASLLTVQRHQEHRTVVASLFRARCAVGGETRAQCALNESMVKNLTGSDPLRARRMREDEWGFLPSHTLILFSNYTPKIEGTDNGIWRRVRLVEWSVTIPEGERDTNLDKKLEAEASGILNWIIEGARIFLAEGLTVPESVKASTAQYRAGEDVVGRFISEVLTITGDSTLCPSADIAEAAKAWAEDIGLDHAPKAKAIASALEILGARTLGQKQHQGVRRTVWRGVRITAGQDVIDESAATLDTVLRVADKGNENALSNCKPEHGNDGSSDPVIDPGPTLCFECGEATRTRSADGEAWCFTCQIGSIDEQISGPTEDVA